MSTFRAHAKLNLALAVAPPESAQAERPGWHRITSWVHAIELCDTIRIESGADGFGVSWLDDPRRPVDWATEQDLAYRAKAALGAKFDEPIRARVEVSKQIPAGAGLGGGSSDAAVTLTALNALAPKPLRADQLADIGGLIGSDVPFFLDGPPPRPALVSNFGDRISRLKKYDLGAVLFVPPFGCPTPAVYAAYDDHPRDVESFDQAADRIVALCRSLIDGDLFNDLEPAACSIAPRLGSLLDTLRTTMDRPVHMSGSGSTLFMLCDPADMIDLADRARESVGHECRVIPTRLT